MRSLLTLLAKPLALATFIGSVVLAAVLGSGFGAHAAPAFFLVTLAEVLLCRLVLALLRHRAPEGSVPWTILTPPAVWLELIAYVTAGVAAGIELQREAGFAHGLCIATGIVVAVVGPVVVRYALPRLLRRGERRRVAAAVRSLPPVEATAPGAAGPPIRAGDLGDTARLALRSATAPGPADTRAVLLALAAVHDGEWDRIWLQSREPDALRAISVRDPDVSRHPWDGATLTGTCARALLVAGRITARWGLGTVSPGALMLGLVADPRSAANRSLTDGTALTQQALLILVQEAILGVTLRGLQQQLPAIVQACRMPPVADR